jgi:predicted transcriptional regulator
LSIKPKFAYAILRGEKKYEFRRNIFARPVDVVLLYASVPVGRVVAEFDVRSIISQPLQTLWNRTKQFAGIGEDYFFRYFQGREYGHAIEIGEVRPYKNPFCPIERLGIRPPQSFSYIDFDFGILTIGGLAPVAS